MKMLLGLIICLTTVGCSTFQQISYSSPNSPQYQIGRFHYEDLNKKYDAYSYQIFYSAVPNSSETDSLYVKKMSFENGLTTYTIIHEYFGRDWRFMKSLVISIDGTDTKLTDDTPQHFAQRDSMVNEVLTYTVDQEFIDRLSKSSNVVFHYWNEPISMSEKKQSAMKDAIWSLESLKYSSEFSEVRLN